MEWDDGVLLEFKSSCLSWLPAQLQELRMEWDDGVLVCMQEFMP
jgi:hypothetical protein